LLEASKLIISAVNACKVLTKLIDVSRPIEEAWESFDLLGVGLIRSKLSNRPPYDLQPERKVYRSGIAAACRSDFI
jgi:hypothetical protein